MSCLSFELEVRNISLLFLLVDISQIHLGLNLGLLQTRNININFSPPKKDRKQYLINRLSINLCSPQQNDQVLGCKLCITINKLTNIVITARRYV